MHARTANCYRIICTVPNGVGLVAIAATVDAVYRAAEERYDQVRRYCRSVALTRQNVYLFIYLFAKTMLYSIKLRQIINMHGLLETAGYLNTSYADP